MYNPRLKDKHALVDLARYGTEARKSIHPDVLIGEHCVKCPPFREGDILDANATVNLIGDTLDCCEVFQTFDEEGQRIAERLDNLEQTQSENYTELSDKVDSLTETHEQDIARLDDKTDNLALNIINQERVVDISKLSEVGGKTSYLVTKLDGSHDTIIVAKGDKGDQGESFSYEDFTPEQLEALKVKGDKGDKGTSITRVQQTTVAYNDRGVNVVTIDLDDGSSSLIQIRNGAGGGDSLQVKQDLQAEIARATSAENALQNNINSVNSRVDHIVEDAPEALDTLLEIAEKLHDEEDAVAALTLEISLKYTKPDTGIPSSDMSESVRASLSKADTALQEHLDISGKANTADLATVATTGEYSDLLNKPVIPTVPTNVSAFTNDAGYLTEHQDISGKANIADLATVATSGSYNDLADKPVIPSLNGYATEQWVQSQNYLTEHQDISGKADKTDLNDYLKNYIETDPTGGHDYVEIGGIKWATMNIGAESITDTGLYFQWGDISGYTSSQCGSGEGLKYFGWTDYKYGNGGSHASDMTKYNATDGKTVLDASDDAVQANWGDSWRMPTKDEYAALYYAVTTTWTTDYQGSGISGLVCTDKTDSSKVLFFPACGHCYKGSATNVGSNGYYWSSSLYDTGDGRARTFGFGSWYVNWIRDNDYGRPYGFPVRGIYTGPNTQRVPVSGVTDTEKASWNNKSDFSGSYNDLTDKPTIPTVPTNVSAFTNDAGYLTQHLDISGKANISDLASVATSGNYNDLINKPTIPIVPTAVSAFTNDVGYLTEHQDISGKQDVISDLDTIRSGAQAGSTALQPSALNNYYNKDQVDTKLGSKQDTISNLATIEAGAAKGATSLQPSDKGVANGVATLNENGIIPSSQLPSYVDDVLEYESSAEFPVTGESGKIYVDLLTNKTYRWGGSDYVEISESLALGETSSTAYAGNKGKATTDAFNAHAANTDIHVTAAKQAAWDAKADVSYVEDNYLKNYIETDPTGGHDFVEIAGIKWATMNIGANSVTDTGLYFQWGDTSGYTAEQVGSGTGLKYFGWADYKYGNGTSEPSDTGISKYNSNDGKTVLDAEDDAATVNMGSNWRMPTTAEYAALGNAVNTRWTQVNGVYGMLCTDKTDSSKTLFFPACGSCIDGSVVNVGIRSYYLSSSLTNNDVRSAYRLFFRDGYADWQNYGDRRSGFPVRGVYVGPESQQISVSGVSEDEKASWNNKSDFSGSYNDLTDKPTIPTVAQSDWNQSDSTAIDYIKNKPTIPTVPTNVSAFTNDAGYLTQHLDISGKADKTDLDDYLKNYIEVEVQPEHDYVEIGGIKWATMNIGAESATDTGLYFQWGDTLGYTARQVGSGTGQKYFGWADYKYGNGTSSPGATGMTKYNSTDGKTVLEASDDAVTANWGDSWRMPTTAEYAALGNAVTTAWTANYQGSGVAGMICTDKTDSSKVLFFPSCGVCFEASVNDVGYFGSYWSSSLYSSNVTNAYFLNFGRNYSVWQHYNDRFLGFPVRGIYVGPESQQVPVQGVTQAEKDTWNAGGTQQQVDWNQTDTTAVDYIKNKPTIPVMPVLAAVATSGDYADLINKPTIPSDYVDLTSEQTITGKKIFKGVDRIVLLGNSANEKPGFAINTSTGVKAGFLEYRGNDKMMVLGIDNHTNVGNNLFKIGIREYSSYSYNATIPLGVNKNATFGTGDVVIPIAVNGVKAGNDGNILITIPAAQVNSDWNASSGVALILNKPTIPSIWTGTQALYDAITTKDSDTIYIITSTS